MQENKTSISKLLGYCFFFFLITRCFVILEITTLKKMHHLHPPLVHFFTQLDSVWYLSILGRGYDVVPITWNLHANYVFFPLLPLLIKGLTYLGLSAIAAGLLLCNACFFAALCLFYRFLETECDTVTARSGTLLLAFSPYNIYFMSIYTESLFFLLTLGCWMAGRQRSWWLLGLSGALMAATRPNGIMILPFALWFAWDDYAAAKKTGSAPLLTYWPILLIPLGLIAYMAYLYVHTGDMLAFVHNQIYWCNRTGWHLDALAPELHQRLQGYAYELVVFFLGLALSGFLMKKRFYKEGWFILVFTMPAVLSGSFTSLARFTATLFTFYFALALLIRGKKITLELVVIMLILSWPMMNAWVKQLPSIY